MTKIVVAISTVVMLSVVLVGTALGSVPAMGDMSSFAGLASFVGAPQPLLDPATTSVAGVQGLPSTSTAAGITGGLIALGIAAAAMALALIRRRSST